MGLLSKSQALIMKPYLWVSQAAVSPINYVVKKLSRRVPRLFISGEINGFKTRDINIQRNEEKSEGVASVGANLAAISPK